MTLTSTLWPKSEAFYTNNGNYVRNPITFAYFADNKGSGVRSAVWIRSFGCRMKSLLRRTRVRGLSSRPTRTVTPPELIPADSYAALRSFA